MIPAEPTDSDPALRTGFSRTNRIFGNEDILYDPEIFVGREPENISRTNRIESKSLEKTAKTLQTLGFIESPESWLGKVDSWKLTENFSAVLQHFYSIKKGGCKFAAAFEDHH